MTTMIRGLVGAGAALAVLACAQPSRAAALKDCDDYASAGLVVEPWEQNTRTFYNGAVRVAVTDTGGEPVCCSSWLVVIFPDVEDELGGRRCMMLGQGEGTGWAGLDVKAIRSSYSAATGLILTVPVKVMREDGNGVRPATVKLALDLRTSRLRIVG